MMGDWDEVEGDWRGWLVRVVVISDWGSVRAGEGWVFGEGEVESRVESRG